MSTLRVSNIEAKADASSPSVNEKVKITNSNGDVLVTVNGETAGITTVGVNTTGKTFDVNTDQKVSFVGDIITSSSFGIGTDTPAYALDLGESPSTIRLVSENNGTAIRIGAGGNGSTDVTLLRVDGASNQHDGESDSSAFGFSVRYMGSRNGNNNSLSIFGDDQTAGTQVEAITINQDGSVGIGTENPTSLLHLSGTTDVKIKLQDIDNGFAASEINIGNGGRDLRFAAPQDIYFEDLDTNIKTLYIKDGGNVGIGTDNPTEKLEIRDGGLLINGSNLTGILTEDVLDDTFVSIDLTQPGFMLGGVAIISTFSTYNNFPQPVGTGMFYYDCGSSISGARILSNADATFPLTGATTSTSTTITDFTDARITIICNTNTLRIANRIGGTRRFKLTFV